MAEDLLKYIREQNPDLGTISDDDIVIRVGNKYPGLLKNPEYADFAKRYKYLNEGSGTVANIARGAAAGYLSDVGTQIYSIAEAAYTAIGAEGAAAQAGELADLSKQIGEDIAGPGANTFASQLGRGAASIVPIMAGGAVAGPSVIPIAVAQSFGSSYRSAVDGYKAQGQTEEEARDSALAPAFATGVVTGLATYGGGKLADLLKVGRGPEGIAQILKSDGWKAATNTLLGEVKNTSLSKSAGKVALGMSVEGAEEALDEFVSGYGVARMSYDPSLTLEDSIKQAIQAFWIGNIIGLPTNIVQEYGARLARIEEIAKTAPQVAAKKLEQLQAEAQQAKQQAAQAPLEGNEQKFADANKDVEMGGNKPIDQLPEDPLTPQQDLEYQLDEEGPILTAEQEAEIESLAQEEAANEEAQAAPPQPVAQEPEPAQPVTQEAAPVEQPAEPVSPQGESISQEVQDLMNLIEPLSGSKKEIRRLGYHRYFAGSGVKKNGGQQYPVKSAKGNQAGVDALRAKIEEISKVKGEGEANALVQEARERLVTKFIAESEETGGKQKAEQLRVKSNEKVSNLLNVLEGEPEDVLSTLAGTGQQIFIPVSVGNKPASASDIKKALADKKDDTSQYDSYDDFLYAVESLIAKDNTLGATFKRVPFKKWVSDPSYRLAADEVMSKFYASIGVEPDTSSSMFGELAQNLDNRLARLEAANRPTNIELLDQATLPSNEGLMFDALDPESLAEGDTFRIGDATYQVEDIIRAENGVRLALSRLDRTTEDERFAVFPMLKGKKLYVDQYSPAPPLPITGTDPTPVEDYSEFEAVDEPFAAVPPPVRVKGVTVEGARTERERRLVQRAIDLLPRIQSKLGGGKISRIKINRSTLNPGASGARSGDFGTIYLSPRGIEILESTNQGTLERVLIEEVIHNYTGLAIHKDWEAQGRPGTFQDYYAEVYRGVFNQLTPRQRQETLFYYKGLTDEDGNFQGDEVSVGEEAFRILTQRALTGEFTEQNFKWGKTLDKQSPLARLIEMLRRFWNSIKAGLMTNSPSISALKTRMNRLLGDSNAIYARSDTPRPVLIGSSQVFLNFDSNTEPKPENGFNDNEGSELAYRFHKSQLEFFTQQDVVLREKVDREQTNEERVNVAADAVDGDFMQKLFSLTRVDLFDLTNRVRGRSVESVSAADAAWVQPQNYDAALTDDIHQGLYELVHKHIQSRADIPDTYRSQGLMYVWSRLSNKARTHAKKNGYSITTEEALAPKKGRGDFATRGYLKSFTTEFIRVLNNRSQKAPKYNPEAVSLDAMVAPTGEGNAISAYELVANPASEIPSLNILNEQIVQTIENMINNDNLLTGTQADMLQFAYNENFQYGWQAKYAKERGLKSRSVATERWKVVQSKIAMRLALDDAEMLKVAVSNMAPETRKTIEEAVGKMTAARAEDQARLDQAREQAKIAERDRNRVEITGRLGKFLTKEQSMEMLRDAANRNLVGSAIPPQLTGNLAAQAKDAQYNAAMNFRDTSPNENVSETSTVSKEAQARINEARNPNTSKLQSIKDKVVELADSVIKGFRQYEFLNPRQYGSVIEVLRQFENTAELSRVEAYQALAGVTDQLSRGQLDMLSNVLVFRDLQRSIEAGLYNGDKELPFGLTKEEVKAQVEAHNADLAKPDNSKVRDALARRAAILTKVTDDLKRLKLLPENITDAENYFHRSIIEYRIAAESESTLANSSLEQGFRTKKAGFQKKRKGSEKDYVTDYQTAETAVLTQAYAQINTNKKLNQLKTLVDNRRVFARKADIENDRQLFDMGIMPSELYAPFDKSIAIGFNKLKALIKKSELNYHPKFGDVVTSLANDTPNPSTFLFLQHLIETKSNGAPAAAMIFKNVQGKKAAVREALGDKFATWESMVKADPNYTTWQPDKGNFLYRGSVVSDNTLEKWIEEADAGDEITISKEQLRRGLILGGKKSTWVVPVEVEKQFKTFTSQPKSKLGTFYQDALGKWKYWKLFNPWGFIKYELNNTTGDFDIVFAYDPEILKGSKQAWADLWDFHKNNKPLTDELRMLIDKGVIGSGYQVSELAEMQSDAAYQGLIGDYLNPTGKKSSWWQKYQKGTSVLNQVREDTLRLAAYRHFKQKLDKGESAFGVSDPYALAQIKDKSDKAAKLARELVGDYGAISRNGRWLRANAIPFYSWMEINLPRYVRLMRNTQFETGQGTGGRVAKVAGKKAAVSAAKAAALASAFSLAVNAWNRAMIGMGFVDEEDKEVLEARKQQHLLLYSTDEGRVISVRFQGALTDALEYFGLGNIFETASDVIFTEETVGSALEQYISEQGYLDGVNRVVNSLTPFVKTPVELAIKQKFYPTAWQTTPMRDRGEYLLQTMEMGPLSWGINTGYNLYKDFPTSGITGGGNVWRSLGQFIGYTTDTGEAAYQYIKAKEYDFMREKGDERPSFSTTSKNDALYYYKKALKFGDERSAKRWLAEYERLGGKKSTIKSSIKQSAPLEKVSKQFKREFLDSLSSAEQDILKRAEKWYQESTK